jgi:hypothetical protein
VPQVSLLRPGIPQTCPGVPWTDPQWKHYPLFCHPDRSEPGFPASLYWKKAACAPFCKERRMMFVNATNVDRKSGGA